MIAKLAAWLNREFLNVSIIVAAILLIWAMLSSHAYAATTSSRNHTNSLGFVVYQDNPNQYLEGAISAANIHSDGGREFTTIRVNPSHTFVMFTVDITFCGDESEMFAGMTGDVVITYSRVMHHTWCFDAYSVHQVKEITPR